jgi:predicted transcriptional regulator
VAVKTTIQVDKKVKDRLESMKAHPKESYNEIIERLISISYDEQELNDQTVKNIEEALEDIKQGRLYTTKQVKERLAIE